MTISKEGVISRVARNLLKTEGMPREFTSMLMEEMTMDEGANKSEEELIYRACVAELWEGMGLRKVPVGIVMPLIGGMLVYILKFHAIPEQWRLHFLNSILSEIAGKQINEDDVKRLVG